MSSVTISRIEIFTGQEVGTNALAVWSDDGGISLSPLGYTQQFTSVLTNSCQGAYLNTPVSVISGNRYWIVWDPEEGQQISASNDGIQQAYWVSSGGTVSGEVSWSGQYSFWHWKFRVFCAEPGTPVDIDIKPGSYPNSINLGSSGNIPVAIFSRADFDATTVDPTTITLADAMVCVKGKGTPMYSLNDENGDGITDMIVHMETSGLKKTDGDTTAQLKGYTNNGTPISGEDSVRVIQG